MSRISFLATPALLTLGISACALSASTPEPTETPGAAPSPDSTRFVDGAIEEDAPAQRTELAMESQPMSLVLEQQESRGNMSARAKKRAGAQVRSVPPRPHLPPSHAQEVALPGADMSGNTHTDHGVNPFTLTTEDALSTFSIDVDTASYSLSRRALRAGHLPVESAVRVEEFVNYFDYSSYAGPTGDMPFAVHIEAMPDPFRHNRHILRVGVQGRELDREQRAPVHLTFLIDVSGSMSSADKLGLAKKSMHRMVNQLREDDTVALATYAGRTARVLEPTPAANRSQIHAAIDHLSAGGSTAMSSGIDIAYEMASQAFRKGHENRVVVLSDGDANVGRVSWDDMLSQIKGHADRGITLSTIGLGTGNYRDTLMEQLANKGDGNNFYIDTEAQAQRVFVEQLPGTMITIARDVKIQVEFAPESVQAYRLIGYENRAIADHQFRDDRVDAGEIGSGHNVTALYEVILAEQHAPELATVRMRWETPGADKAASEKAFVFPEQALMETPSLASRDTRIAFAAATFAEILRASPYTAELDMSALLAFTETAARTDSKDDAELITLMQTAQRLGAGAAVVAQRD